MPRTLLAPIALALLWPTLVFAALDPAPDRSASTRGAGSRTSEDTITIAFGGDVTLSRHVGLVAEREGLGAPLGEVSELRDADLAIVNLESVVAASGERNPAISGVAPHHFRGRPELLGVLREAGVDVVTTANTHALDYGQEALLEQLSNLSSMGIAAPGTGEDRAAACAPAYVEQSGIVIAVLSFDTTQPATRADAGSPGACHVELDPDAAMAELEPLMHVARQRAHVVLVAPHWGVDFEADPSEAKRELGRRLVEAGADAVLGSHAHQLQGIETHLDRPILHDAGNLLLHFDTPTEAGLFELTVSVDGVHRIEYIPLIAEQGLTRRPSSAEAEELLGKLERRSARLGTTVDSGTLELVPPARAEPTDAASLSERETSSAAPAPLVTPPADCVVESVPADAAIEPVATGPLTLVGVRARPVERFWPSFLRVESYWRVDAPVDDSLLLVGTAGRDGAEGTPGWSEEQEPCDWRWPTSRWEVGTIYRDEMLLRPSDGLTSPLGVILKLTGRHSPAPIHLGVEDRDGTPGLSVVVDRVSYGLPIWVVVSIAVAAIASVAGTSVLVGRRLLRRRTRG